MSASLGFLVAFIGCTGFPLFEVSWSPLLVALGLLLLERVCLVPLSRRWLRGLCLSECVFGFLVAFIGCTGFPFA